LNASYSEEEFILENFTAVTAAFQIKEDTGLKSGGFDNVSVLWLGFPYINAAC
jgi:hypothetical protein